MKQKFQDQIFLAFQNFDLVSRLSFWTANFKRFKGQSVSLYLLNRKHQTKKSIYLNKNVYGSNNSEKSFCYVSTKPKIHFKIPWIINFPNIFMEPIFTNGERYKTHLILHLNSPIW